MMKSYFDNLVSGIETALKTAPGAPSPRKQYALEIAKLGSRLYSGEERVAWCGVVAPFDLLNAMGVTSCYTEFIGAMLASTGMIGDFLEKAEHEGYPADICGYHRAVLGAALNGWMPEPDFLIATTCPCSGGLTVMETLAAHFRKDLFVLNIPQDDSPESVRYLAGQIRDMARFVADHTGVPLDMGLLRTAVAHTNEARDLMEEVYGLARAVPSPADGRMLANFGIVMALLLGTPECVDVIRAYRETFARRVENGVSGIGDEKLRLMWIQNRIQFKHPLIDLLEKEYGAVVVADELNDITWGPIDPEDPFDGLARRAISIPFNGHIDRRILHLRKQAGEYRLDGAINPCHWGCRQGTGARGLITEGLKEIGVPVLNLEVDCVDSRNFFEGQLRTRIEAFMEMLRERKG